MAEQTNILPKIPTNPDITERYLFYLHGLIIEEAGIRPKSEEHGYYEYELILETFAEKGFIVISEAREKGTQVIPYAEKIVSEIKQLLENGVAAKNITIVGASKGGAIAVNICNMLKEKQLNYVFLAGLFEKYSKDKSIKLYGNVLSIHDQADKLSITPSVYFERSRGLGDFKQITLNLDLGHGLIYKPHREWTEPIWQWLQMG